MRIIISALLSCLLASAVVAQTNEAAWSVGASAAYVFGPNIANPSFFPSLQVGYASEHGLGKTGWFVELSASQWSDSDEFAEEGFRAKGTLDVTSLAAVVGVLPVTRDEATFYLLGGLGRYAVDMDFEIDASGIPAFMGYPDFTATADLQVDVQDAIGAIIGGGLKILPARHFAIWLDYRYVFLTLKSIGTFTITVSHPRYGSLGETFVEEATMVFDHSVARLGLSYQF